MDADADVVLALAVYGRLRRLATAKAAAAATAVVRRGQLAACFDLFIVFPLSTRPMNLGRGRESAATPLHYTNRDARWFNTLQFDTNVIPRGPGPR